MLPSRIYRLWNLKVIQIVDFSNDPDDISNFLSNEHWDCYSWFQMMNHGWHDPKMLNHGMIGINHVGIELKHHNTKPTDVQP